MQLWFWLIETRVSLEPSVLSTQGAKKKKYISQTVFFLMLLYVSHADIRTSFKCCKTHGKCHENVLKRTSFESITDTVMFIWSLHFYFRDKLAFTQSRAASYFFDGSSYAIVRDITRRGKFGQVTRFDIEVRTPTDNGLVLLMVNGVSKKSYIFSLIAFTFPPCMFLETFPSWVCHAIKLKV